MGCTMACFGSVNLDNRATFVCFRAQDWCPSGVKGANSVVINGPIARAERPLGVHAGAMTFLKKKKKKEVWLQEEREALDVVQPPSARRPRT